MLLVLLSLVPAALCYYLFAVQLPSDGERYQDYRAAKACPAHATGQTREDCLRTSRFTVVKTEAKNTGKTKSYYATLKGGGSRRSVVEFEDSEPLFERLEQGDQVAATVWHRDIVVLSKGGVQQNSSDAPRDALQIDAAFGTLFGLLALQAFGFGAGRLVRSRSFKLLTWNPYGGWTLALVLVAGLVVGTVAEWIGIPWGFVPPAVPVVACLMAWVVGSAGPRKWRRSARQV